MSQVAKYIYNPKGQLYAMTETKGVATRGTPTYSISISSQSLIGNKKELAQMGRCASFISFCKTDKRIKTIG